MSNCTVYIDEAGDLGYKRGTQWFVLSAAIVDKADEANIVATIRQIKARLNVHEIHLKTRALQDFYKRAFIVRSLRNAPFTYVNVIVDTGKFNLPVQVSTSVAYNYICRMLLERVSWFLRDTNRVGDIVLSARGTAHDGELIDYITNKLLPYPNNEIASGVFDNVIAKKASSWDMLQFADVCATTMFASHEINGLGFCSPCFSKALQSHLYSYKGKIAGYGIKYFSPDMIPQKANLESYWACM